jgi:hypothetical protein
MIRATSPGFNASVSGLAIYLDNWAVIELAKHNRSRRKRFIRALQTGRADLVFSVTNAAEVIGPQGQSREAVRAFLDGIGPHWFPVELDANEVVRREQSGAEPAKCCISEDFLKHYWVARMRANPSISRKAEVFHLGAILDWLGPQRESIRATSAKLGDALVERIDGYRIEYDRNPLWLDQNFQVVPFNPFRRARFTYDNLIRTLILEAKSCPLEKNDGLDFCHAVMGSAFASFATLDTKWKRRVESLPKPNGLAPIYGPLQLDQMVMDIEHALGQLRATR